MKNKICATCLLIVYSSVLFADDFKLANNTDNDISLNTNSGLLSIRKFDGIEPQNTLTLGEDIFTTKQMEGKFAPTVWTTVKKENDTITLSTTLQKETAGIDLDGVKYSKTFKFNPSVPEIQVTMEFSNTSDKLRYAYWGVRNQFRQRPNVNEAVFIPRTIGTFPHGVWSFLNFYAKPAAWSSTVAENWCAKMDVGKKAGLAFLLDPSVLGALYTNQGENTGFMFDGGYLAPGASITATYSIRPVKQLSSVTTVNPSFAAGIKDGGSKIQLTIFPYEKGELSGELEVLDKNRKSVFRKSVKLSLEKGSLAKRDVSHPKMTDHSAVIFSGTMNGKKFATEQYCENGVRMQSVAANTFAPSFLRPALKKDNTGTATVTGVSTPRKKQAVCLFGLYTPFNRFDKILDGWKIDNYSVWNVGMKEIPPASTLDEYSVMIIGNAFATGMEVCLQRVKSFVANGGVLIVTGGPSAFGTGGYENNTILKELLPASGKPYDLQPVAGKNQFDKGRAITGKGIDAAKAPCVYWLHQSAKIRPSAEILWKTENKPVLVKDSFGKGKVLCFLGSPLGDPQDGTTPYWESQEYVNAMREIITTTIEEAK